MISQGAAATSYEKFHVMRVYMKGAHAALRKHNCYPWRTFATPLMMTPLFFASVLGARHLVMMGDESFETGASSGYTVRRGYQAQWLLLPASLRHAHRHCRPVCGVADLEDCRCRSWVVDDDRRHTVVSRPHGV